MANLFFVRSDAGNYTQQFIKGNYVAIGWLDEDDLFNVNSREEIRKLYKEYHSNIKSNYTVGQNVGQIYRFLHEIKRGDYVLTQSTNSSHIHYGMIRGNYYFEPNSKDDCPFSHRKRVKWLGEIARNKFTNAFQNSIRSNLTVFHVSELKNFFKVIGNPDLSVDDNFSTPGPKGLAIGNPRNIKAVFDEIPSQNFELNIVREYKISPKEDKGGVITLFYGTNRNKTVSKEVNEYYGEDLSELKFGKCTVSIPRGHTQGEIERPKNLWVIKFPENEENHVVLKTITEKAEHQFFQELENDIKLLPEKSAMIFIHGYNTTFAEAARRAGQIAWDIPFNGISGFYSWPSCGKTIDYGKDIEQADSTIPLLVEFIEKFVSQTGIEKLHIIAHSMGNRLLTASLNNLSTKTSFYKKIEVLQQIILAAPDIDQNVFKNTILPQFQNVGARRTLYSSDQDKALHYSKKIRDGLPRLGDAGNSLFIENGLDTVDASNVKSEGNHHSYIFETPELLTDLYYLLNHGLDPINRRLRARTRNSLQYWLFPK